MPGCHHAVVHSRAVVRGQVVPHEGALWRWRRRKRVEDGPDVVVEDLDGCARHFGKAYPHHATAVDAEDQGPLLAVAVHAGRAHADAGDGFAVPSDLLLKPQTTLIDVDQQSTRDADNTKREGQGPKVLPPLKVQWSEGLKGSCGATFAGEAQLDLAFRNVLPRVHSGVSRVKSDKTDDLVGSGLWVHEPAQYQQKLMLPEQILRGRIACLLLPVERWGVLPAP